MTNGKCGSAGNQSFGQVVFLNFDGAETCYRNEQLTLELPVLVSPSRIPPARRKRLLESLNRNASGIQFSAGSGTNTIHIGHTRAFDRFGRFAGLAEGIGTGNAFVMLDDSAGDAELLDVIRHEGGHILGLLDHGGAGLARYAAFTHEYKSWELQGGGPDNWIIYQDPSRIGAPYLFKQTITTVTYHAQPDPAAIDNISLVAEDSYTVYEYLYDFTCKLLAYGGGYYWNRYDTEYIEVKKELNYFYEASGTNAKNIYINGGKADNCTAVNIDVRGYLTGYNVRTEGDENGWEYKKSITGGRKVPPPDARRQIKLPFTAGRWREIARRTA